MELCREYLFVLLHILYLVENISSGNTTEKFEIIVPEKAAPQKEISPAQNNTIDKLVQEQTDLIKKIISNHKATTIDYPVVTRKEVEVKEDAKIKKEKEQESIESLRRRCQVFFAIKDGNNAQKIAERSEPQPISTVEAFGPIKKPEFLQKPKIEGLPAPTLPPNFSNPTQVEQIPKKYFLITRNRTTDNHTNIPNVIPKPQNLISQTQTIQNPLQENIKYVQLEPIILQKMILNNGRMLFYWYNSIPMIPQYVQVPKYRTPPPQDSTFKYPSQLKNTLTYPSQAAPYEAQVSKVYPSSTSYSQTYPNSSFISNIQKYPSPLTNTHNYQPQIPNTPQAVPPPPEVLPNYEIEYGTTEKTNDELFKKQMKFVIPMPYPAGDGAGASTRYPWQFDPYAYYPKSLQPSTINVPLPYVPTFHMVRTLHVPNNLMQTGNGSV